MHGSKDRLVLAHKKAFVQRTGLSDGCAFLYKFELSKQKDTDTGMYTQTLTAFYLSSCEANK